MSAKTFLSDSYSRAKERNASLSLRAFAKQIGMTPSHLSDVFYGRKTLSLKKAQEVGKNLFLGEEDFQRWMSLVALDLYPEGQSKQKLAAMNEANDETVAVETFNILSHWYILPMLELANTDDCVADAKEMARRLGITPLDATMALDRLQRFKLLTLTRKKVKRTHRKIVFSSEASQENLQRFHKQMMMRSIDALTTQTNAEKYVGTETMAFDPADLPAVKAAFDEFFDRVSALAARGKNKTQVYHMGMQFFRLTKS